MRPSTRQAFNPQIEVSILIGLPGNRPGHMLFTHSYQTQTSSPKASPSFVGRVAPSKRLSLNGQPYCSSRIPTVFVIRLMSGRTDSSASSPVATPRDSSIRLPSTTAAATAMEMAYTRLSRHSRIKQDTHRWPDYRVIGSRTYPLFSKYSSSPSQAGAASNGPV
jgi:hypothetical protein